MYKYLLVIFLLAGCAFTAMAQQPLTSPPPPEKSKDTLISTKKDTIAARSFIPKVKKAKEKVFHPDSTHDPHKAFIRSLLIPGWGQVYNHRWWKVPVIYGGLSLLGVAIVFNNTYYNQSLTIAHYLEHGVIPTPNDKYYSQYQLYVTQGGYSSSAIDDATDSYRRNRDLCILGVLGAWGINVVDAYIDAKFQHSYTVDNNFSMKVEPSVISQPMYAQTMSSPFIPGLKITFAF